MQAAFRPFGLIVLLVSAYNPGSVAQDMTQQIALQRAQMAQQQTQMANQQAQQQDPGGDSASAAGCNAGQPAVDPVSGP